MKTTSKFVRILKYATPNVLFVALLYYALYAEITGAQNLLIAIVWIMTLLSTFLIANSIADKAFKASVVGKIIPEWVDTTLDCCIIAALAWYGWFWITGAYFFHFLVITACRQNYNKRVSAKNIKVTPEPYKGKAA